MGESLGRIMYVAKGVGITVDALGLLNVLERNYLCNTTEGQYALRAWHVTNEIDFVH